MDRETLVRFLIQAERHVQQGARQLARQRELISDLEQEGQDAREARLLLGEFEEMQSLHVADRDRLAEELAEYDGP